MKKPKAAELIAEEMERRYGFFSGEHPSRGKVRLILDTEPMARWLARAEIAKELANIKRKNNDA